MNSQTNRPRSSGKMRAPRQRPGSQHGAQSSPKAPTVPIRKVFNCIVDDTALVAGVKKSTRNGIRQWVKNGQLRLFVPLHALEQLSRQKNATNRHGDDVRETLQWLDDATTRYPHAVTLQGGDQYFPDWTEVERFAVPRTLFSEADHIEDSTEPEPDASSVLDKTNRAVDLGISGLNRKTSQSSAGSAASAPDSPGSLKSMRSSISAFSPPTSPAKLISSPARPSGNSVQHRPETSSASVPKSLQPLLNYILWRIHQELDPAAALESFIFLCNDSRKVNHARGFDIRYKRLEQLREVIGREDRDFRNRMQLINRENQNVADLTPAVQAHSVDGGFEDEFDNDDAGSDVVFRPPPRAPAAMISKQQQPNVMDPNAFTRSTPTAPSPKMSPPQPRSPRFSQAQPQTPRGGQNASFSPRGRGGFRGSVRGNPGRGGQTPSDTRVPSAASQPGGQIDPDSFARPRGHGNTGRGSRKLWVPT